MAKKQKIVVKTPIGEFSRTTARTYTHIVVGHWDLDRARKAAFNYQGSDLDRQNFDYYQRQVDLGVAGLKAEHAAKWKYPRDDADFEREYANALYHVQGGFEGYVDRKRRDCIEHFHKSVGEGGFNPFAFAWCGRLDLAMKQADAARKRGLLDVEIFPVQG